MIKGIHKAVRAIGRWLSDWWGLVLGILGVILLIVLMVFAVNSSSNQNTARCNREEDTMQLVAKNDPQDFPRVFEMFRYDCGSA